MLGEGDYIDWHCSGIVQTYQDDDEWFKTATEEQLERYKKGQAHVGEGIVTDEIREDFLKLGWQLVWEYVPD
jgi:predicted kinase